MPRRIRGWFFIGGGGGAALLLAVMALLDQGDPTRFQLPFLVLVALAAVALGSVGVADLVSARQAAAGGVTEGASYRHAYRLFAVVGLALVAALVARHYAVPDGFGRFGFYRAAAAAEEARIRTPRFQGREICAECHDMEATAHAKDVHRTVQCESCHGHGDRHLEDPANAHMEVPTTRDACLVCHRKLTARPGAFPQVSWRDHYAFVGVADEKVTCIKCHDPHEPLYLDKPLAEARLHPLIQRCRDCHLGRTDETLVRPAAHPAIFECAYCHRAKAEDFKSRTHLEARCTTCHLFLKESEFAGRIVRNRDPRFCLLCHRKGDFRSKDAPAGIAWPEHLKDVGAETGDETTSCMTCHADAIHGEETRSER